MIFASGNICLHLQGDTNSLAQNILKKKCFDMIVTPDNEHIFWIATPTDNGLETGIKILEAIVEVFVNQK